MSHPYVLVSGKDSAGWCWTTPFGKTDWTPCFRIHILNEFIPLISILISALLWAAFSLRDQTKRRQEIAREVAQLNPESSHFYNTFPAEETQPVYEQPANAAQRVFQTENAILIDEALSIKEDLSTRAANEEREQQWRRKIMYEFIIAVMLAITYVVNVMLTGVKWERSWLAFWVYFVAMAGVSYVNQTSLYLHKLLLSSVATVVTISNLRSLFIVNDKGIYSMQIIVVIQTLLTFIMLGLSVFSPLSQKLPSALKALLETMHKRTLFCDLRTAVPTPPHITRAREDVGQLVPSYSNKTQPLLPPPEQHASLLSRALFMFVQPAIWKHYFQPITLPDIPQLMAGDRAASATAIFRTHNGPETQKPLWRRLIRHFVPTFAYQSFFAFLATLLTVVPVFFLSRLLHFFTTRANEGPDEAPIHLGIFFALGMFVSQVFLSICQSQALMTGRHICVQIRAILTFEVLSKTMRRGISMTKPEKAQQVKSSDDDTEDDKAPATDGAVTNLVSVDVSRISEFAAYIHFLLPEQPLIVVLCVIYLIALLGKSGVIGLVLLVVAIPFQTYLSRVLVSIGTRMLRATDERLNLANEVLACIKTVKFFAWEKPFETRMKETREKELRLLRTHFFFSILNHITFIGTPMLVTMATFGAHTLLFKEKLTAEKAFTALALFNTLRRPLADLPGMIHWLLSAIVSVRRINNYLIQEETHKYEQLLGDDAQAAEAALHRTFKVIGFDHASFTYGADNQDVESDGRFMLHDINCKFPVGKISVVIGPVGSGKTSLLMALLGELQCTKGRVVMPCPIARSLVKPNPMTHLTESTAYCSQSAWLLGTTIRQNILFGSDYDEARYMEVLHACALEPDLDILEFHDETEVGEKGTALSGGQKARIALARAFYSHAKHILIDDALSAVDAHTAKHLYEHCLKGPLAQGRTIILVTHAVSLMLPSAAYTVVMEDGRVAAEGPPQKLLADGQIPDMAILAPDSAEETGPKKKMDVLEEDERKKKMEERRAKKALADQNEEKISREQSSLELYWFYMSAVAKSPYVALIVWIGLTSLYLSIRAIDVSSGAWLRNWANSYKKASSSVHTMIYSWISLAVPLSNDTSSEDQTWYYMKGYSAIVLAFIGISLLTDILQYAASLQASKRLYGRMVKSLLLAKPQFYDKTPIGRITNRLSRDMEEVDQELSPVMQMTVENLIALIAIGAVICWAAPKFLFVLAFVILMYFMIGSMYLASSRDLKRIESIQRSPLYTLVGETIAGTVTIPMENG
ncbi:atp-dependent bile acid permease [Malassezia pachydermatis]|uniref:Atp-dependent bile acid permease n=1 Tax=Malassezia pachydermatis TaxID=77020 RepID=A0A0M8MIV3_9BASI|nr:atp-dependent bile acid permease [Malassezia pachydermatis]KOS12408.1 atp-dependent bile acid permease [Malassezia pachydermatis]